MFLFYSLALLLVFSVLTLVLLPVSSSKASGPTSLRHRLGMAGTVLVMTSVGYFSLGNSQLLSAYWHHEQMQGKVADMRAQLQSPEAVIQKLKGLAEQHPDNPKGWYLLGRLYFSTEQFGSAVQAFSKAYAITPDDNNTAIQYAQALFLLHNKKFTPKARHLLRDVPVSYTHLTLPTIYSV